MPAVGRGGAGNIQILQQDEARLASDVEANGGQSTPNAQQDSLSKSIQPLNSTREDQQYAHSGRGGAGNYYSPKELKQTGVFHDADTSRILGSGTPAPKPTKDRGRTEAPRIYGRGGAGNYVDNRADAEKAEADKAKAEQDLKASIEQDVNESLAAPAKAVLPAEEV